MNIGIYFMPKSVFGPIRVYREKTPCAAEYCCQSGRRLLPAYPIRFPAALVPNRALERLFIHFLSFMSLSVRFCPPAGICAAVSSSHSLLHFRRNDHPSARQPGKINRDSDERSGGRQNRNRLGDDMTKRVAENALPENENKG